MKNKTPEKPETTTIRIKRDTNELLKIYCAQKRSSMIDVADAAIRRAIGAK